MPAFFPFASGPFAQEGSANNIGTAIADSAALGIGAAIAKATGIAIANSIANGISPVHVYNEIGSGGTVASGSAHVTEDFFYLVTGLPPIIVNGGINKPRIVVFGPALNVGHTQDIIPILQPESEWPSLWENAWQDAWQNTWQNDWKKAWPPAYQNSKWHQQWLIPYMNWLTAQPDPTEPGGPATGNSRQRVLSQLPDAANYKDFSDPPALNN